MVYYNLPHMNITITLNFKYETYSAIKYLRNR